MPPKGVSTRLKPIRLQTIKNLRIRRPNKQEPGRCQTAMSAVLNCWASSGHNIQGCHALEQQLRQCMDTAKYEKPKKNPINFHLNRIFPMIAGPRKKK